MRAERKRLGVTQEEMAWRADMHRSYLADIERGRRNVTLKSVANLAQALQVSVVTLLGDGDGDAARGGADGRTEFREILLVEDNADEAELTLRAFKRAHCPNPVKVVRDGPEAMDYLLCRVRYAHRRPQVPQLVLLDLNLPGMSGIDVLRAMKGEETLRHIPVVVLTVSRRDENILACARLGAANYIVKPFGFDEFAAVTRELDLRWALVEQRANVGVGEVAVRRRSARRQG